MAAGITERGADDLSPPVPAGTRAGDAPETEATAGRDPHRDHEAVLPKRIQSAQAGIAADLLPMTAATSVNPAAAGASRPATHHAMIRRRRDKAVINATAQAEVAAVVKAAAAADLHPRRKSLLFTISTTLIEIA